ncbi:MAG: hypothetical protein COV29_01805 [Candidatus Yanofskybacteria bacterium CG10_big_fil_rev_8_21_14_0_10_36_16]|uniref:Uncharacterized protein n=1 Tax=Candidatus Yanofskybacteria bacterium CG10_big_fil_rev_8_21_14_0_10_36_16 TaxID=1975096 RepID=A0A2J0Q7P0_9BACT|nr:MAG: hypothetical protein COV29_01805 [Candidatus Yanofskybacteria bacterium CG10_big_fil_rev_8_21_14_0_10_36_16]
MNNPTRFGGGIKALCDLKNPESKENINESDDYGPVVGIIIIFFLAAIALSFAQLSVNFENPIVNPDCYEPRVGWICSE